jgi:hypothetical protein
MGKLKKIIVGLMVGGFFSIGGAFAQHFQTPYDGENGKQCHAPGDNYKHQFSHMNSNRGHMKDVRYETSDINHNYKQQAGGTIFNSPGNVEGNVRESGRLDDLNLEGVIINHNYKQQAGAPVPEPERAVVVNEQKDIGC